jgi:hypothetical protein
MLLQQFAERHIVENETAYEFGVVVLDCQQDAPPTIWVIEHLFKDPNLAF